MAKKSQTAASAAASRAGNLDNPAASSASAPKPSSSRSSKRSRSSYSTTTNSRLASGDSLTSASATASSASPSGYSTPLTSHLATPVPTGDASRPSRDRLEIKIPMAPPADSKKALSKSIYSMSGPSKRKWNEVADSDDDDLSDFSPDSALALRLQKEEEDDAYVAKSAPAKTSLTAGRRSTRNSKRISVIELPDSDEQDDEDFDDFGNLRISPKASASVKKPTRQVENKPGPKSFIADSEDVPSSSGSAYESDSEEQETLKPRARPSTKSAPAKRAPAKSAPAKRGRKRLVKRARSPTPPPVSSPPDSDDEISDSDLVATSIRGRRARHKVPHMSREERDRARLEKNHPYLTTLWEDFKAIAAVNPPPDQQPSNISRTLKPFQLQGVAWMKAMEKTDWKGGLLGDEMGLGKTIQAVSLIMSDWPVKVPSLVLAPPVALIQWMSEIESYTDGTLKTLVYHGSNAASKALTAAQLKKYDVIIMSYNSLESLYRRQEKGHNRKDGVYKAKSPIHNLTFHRVILDEAHCIKSRVTMTSKACFALKTKFRWCLTGTPLQNRIGEFFSLVRFLKIEPFANYLCRDCPCSSVEWNMNDNHACSKCKHGSMRHVSVFNQELLNPIQKYGNSLLGAEAFRKLRLLTSKIMLRRLKKDHMDSMELPIKEIIVDRQFFGEAEKDLAGSVMHNSKRQFDTYVAQGVVLNNYANIFGLLNQLRQLADHPDLILKRGNEGGRNIMVCCICDDAATDAIRSQCKHDFCRSCASSYVNSAEYPACPRCHIPLSIDLEQPECEQDEAMVKKNSIINRIKMEEWTSSTKMEMLVHALQGLRSDSSSPKSIIFSQFTGMLELIEWRLRRAGVTTVMLNGSMTPPQRAASINEFMTNPDVECFLVSLKAGGVALNLTEASHVFIVDPWWNPAAEWQSADRVHRIGQTRPVVITRLCIEDSIESRILELQEKKTKMINSTVNSDDMALDSLAPEDLQFLFRGT